MHLTRTLFAAAMAATSAGAVPAFRPDGIPLANGNANGNENNGMGLSNHAARAMSAEDNMNSGADMSNMAKNVGMHSSNAQDVQHMRMYNMKQNWMDLNHDILQASTANTANKAFAVKARELFNLLHQAQGMSRDGFGLEMHGADGTMMEKHGTVERRRDGHQEEYQNMNTAGNNNLFDDNRNFNRYKDLDPKIKMYQTANGQTEQAKISPEMMKYLAGMLQGRGISSSEHGTYHDRNSEYQETEGTDCATLDGSSNGLHCRWVMQKMETQKDAQNHQGQQQHASNGQPNNLQARAYYTDAMDMDMNFEEQDMPRMPGSFGNDKLALGHSQDNAGMQKGLEVRKHEQVEKGDRMHQGLLNHQQQQRQQEQQQNLENQHNQLTQGQKFQLSELNHQAETQKQNLLNQRSYQHQNQQQQQQHEQSQEHQNQNHGSFDSGLHMDMQACLRAAQGNIRAIENCKNI